MKENNYTDMRAKLCEVIRNLYIKFSFLKESEKMTDADRAYYDRILAVEVSNPDISSSLYQLSDFLYRYYGKRVIILLDEYDTPMQEAYVDGFWDELVSFTRNLFNSTFKTNPYLDRAIMTGITRVSKESIFSDLNNLKVVTTTSDEYATSFGFTEEEVFAALEECNLAGEKEEVKHWYDVVLEPRNPAQDDALILEFKVHDPEDEATLKDTVAAARTQIEEKQYATALLSKGIPAEHIRKYGFAFEGKKVLIG